MHAHRTNNYTQRVKQVKGRLKPEENYLIYEVVGKYKHMSDVLTLI